MSRSVSAILFCLSLLVPAAKAHPADLPDFTGLVGKAAPTVVNISTTQRVALPDQSDAGTGDGQDPYDDLYRRFFGQTQPDRGAQAPPEHDASSLGSGFIISADGYILTNYHVIQDAEEVIVKLSDLRQLPARIVGTDQDSDLALLKIDAKDLPVAAIGDVSKLKVGEWVLAIGSPFGFDHSVTAGIVSAKGRSIGSERYVPYIQTDVAINPGNSGGPLLNMRGEVVGINSQIYSRTGGYMGVSFAIPIDLAMDVARQLREAGHVTRGWLGVSIQDVTRELADSFGLSRPEGALVTRVTAGGPAARAGIKVGDVILRYGNHAIYSSSALPPLVGRTGAGSTVAVDVVREGKHRELQVAVGRLAGEDHALLANNEAQDIGHLGVTVRTLTPAERRELDVARGGVVISNILGEPARGAGLRAGDAIVRLGSTPIVDPKQFAKVQEALVPGRLIPLLVHRRSGAQFITLRPAS